MLILFLVGSLLVLANTMNPDVQTDSFSLEAASYNFRDEVTLHKDNQPVTVFEPAGVGGLGVSLHTRHRDHRKWRHHLNLRYYRDSNYHLMFYTTGLALQQQIKKLPYSVEAGLEVGLADLEVYSLQNKGKMKPAWGWDLHVGLTGYFVAFNRLMHYRVTPSLRQYSFEFKGKSDYSTENINGNAYNITLGVGTEF